MNRGRKFVTTGTAILSLAGVVGQLPGPGWASSFDREAARISALALANMARITTLSYDLTTVSQPLDGRGSPLGEPRRRDERIACTPAGRMLKLTVASPARRGYVADARRHILLLREGAATSMSDTSPPEQVEAMARPYPGWVWQPAEVLPAPPALVWADGADLVLASGAAHPRLVCSLDRATGVVRKFTVTDRDGNPERSVEYSGWTKVNEVWVPETVVEELRGSVRGLRRTMTFANCAVNAPLPAGTFAAP